MRVKKTEIKIKTEGIHAKILVDGKELKGVRGYRFSHNVCESEGLPVFQIDLDATHVTLETDRLPALPHPFNQHYIPISLVLDSGKMTQEEIEQVCREHGLKLG